MTSDCLVFFRLANSRPLLSAGLASQLASSPFLARPEPENLTWPVHRFPRLGCRAFPVPPPAGTAAQQIAESVAAELLRRG